METDKVLGIKAFLPARDYELSIQFYKDLGFTANFSNNEISEFQLGEARFLLTPYYVREFAENLMMQLMVRDLDAWWQRINEAALAQQYPGIICKAPELQPWGLRILFLSDPSGVLWHIAEEPAA